MPGGRVLPNIGLRAFFDLGEDYWDADDSNNDYMSTNLLLLSVLVQGAVSSKVSTTPGSPSDGDVHLFDETHPTNANAIAIYDVDTWKYITPLPGWAMYNQDAGYAERFNGSAWAEIVSGGAGGGSSEVQTEAGNYTVAPADEGKYIRLTSGSTKTITVDPESTTALPANGEWHFRNVGAGDATISPGGGVTVDPPNGGTLVIPQGGTATLKRAGEDLFELFGQVVAA